MSNQHHPQTDEEIFSSALAFESLEEQKRCVVMQCAGDLQQVDRVLHLLESHRKLVGVKTTFVLDRPDEVCIELMAEESLAEGEMIGSYRVMQLLGEGGMGLVYQAEQLAPIRRQVAVKVLKPGMDSHQVLARFELERQALAGMEHPGMTRILDAGIAESGRPYFVMELVNGIPITEYCRTHDLSPRECIQLMIPVCSAIQHAHQRGIIHRDIKPSNILVAPSDNGPIPKVIDFGIAKVVNESMGQGDQFTQHGEMIGTPEYMSPEQAIPSAEGIDTRTDVYSLGVLLYELFTGETPLVGLGASVGLSRLRQLFSDSRVEMPSQRITRRRSTAQTKSLAISTDQDKPERFLRGDIDCIVMKALARDPNDRYQSVSELKQDLERFVKGLPIEAVPPSLLYSIKKLVLRHRVLAMAASLACFSIFVASATAIRFGFVANDRLRDVLAMQSELKIERDRAVEAERKARLLAQSYLAPAVLDRAIMRYSLDHWDQLVAVNPKLQAFPIPKQQEELAPEILSTLFNSNLLTPDERLNALGESDWLIKVLSDISKKDVGHLLNSPSSSFVTSEVEPSPAPTTTPTPANGETKNGETAEQQLPVGEFAESDASNLGARTPAFHFPDASKKTYLDIFCEELRAIDRQLPFVADAEDSIGLCLLDMHEPSLAIDHFRESIRIREGYPELRGQSLQSELFIAECLKQHGNYSEAKSLVAKVRSECRNNPRGLEMPAIEILRKAADAIDAPSPSESP